MVFVLIGQEVRQTCVVVFYESGKFLLGLFLCRGLWVDLPFFDEPCSEFLFLVVQAESNGVK